MKRKDARTIERKICLGCGVEFENFNTKFCTKKCYEKHHTLAQLATLVCQSCGLPFQNSQTNARWCKTCVPNAQAHHRMRYYGISEAEFQVLLKRSGGMCELCFIKPWTDIDHDHQTKRVRGLLCHKCNWSLHVVEQYDADWLLRAKTWLS